MGNRAIKVFVNQWKEHSQEHRSIVVMTRGPSTLLSIMVDPLNELMTVALEIDAEELELDALEVDAVPPTDGFVHRLALLTDRELVPGEEFSFHSISGRFLVYHAAEMYP